MKLFDLKMNIPFQDSFSLEFNQSFGLLRILDDEMAFPITAILLQVKDDVDDSWNFLRVGFIDGFGRGFEGHIGEIYSQGLFGWI